MNRLITYSAILLIVIGFRAEAATEYLRFTGSISPVYGSGLDGYDPTHGLTASQTVYFDFAIDTALDAVGIPDSFPFTDNFFASYIDGSVTGNGDNYGQTAIFPEGITTFLFVTNSLRVGINWDRLNDTNLGLDFSINTWATGTSVDLLGNSYFSTNRIASLTLAYRDITPPPAYVPLPAAIWLFGSGLIGLIGLARKKVRV